MLLNSKYKYSKVFFVNLHVKIYNMIAQFLMLFGGLILVLLGSNWLVDGSSSIAKKTGLSEFVIGLTIVGIGTSTPEMVVSYMSAFQGKADMAIGNVVGSNIFNTLMILGITALICPLIITRQNIKRDIPLNIIVTLILIGLGMKYTLFGVGSNTLTRVDGAIMLAIFAIYMWRSFKIPSEGDDDEGIKVYSSPVSALLIIAGLVGLIGGGRLFVNSATEIARYYHLSEKFIAITIMSVGTSLPELATCVVAALKGRGQLALGNIIGSNISNILLILGGASLIRPLSLGGMTYVDLGVVFLSSIMIFISAYTFRKREIDRVEGTLFLILEAAYLAWLFIKI